MLRETGEMMKANVPPAAVVRVVACEKIEQRTDGCLENVPRAARPQFKPRPVRTHPHHASPAHLQLATVRAGRLHESKIANRRVQPAVHSQLQPVGCVIGRSILERPADARDQRLLLLRHSIVITVNEHTDVGRVQQVESILIPDQTARRIHVRHERFHLVRLSIPVGVAHAQHPAHVRLPIQRAVSVAGNVERAVHRSRDKHRIIHRRRRRKDRDIETIRGLHVLQQCGGFRGHDGGKLGQFLRRGLAVLGGKG